MVQDVHTSYASTTVTRSVESASLSDDAFITLSGAAFMEAVESDNFSGSAVAAESVGSSVCVFSNFTFLTQMPLPLLNTSPLESTILNLSSSKALVPIIIPQSFSSPCQISFDESRINRAHSELYQFAL